MMGTVYGRLITVLGLTALVTLASSMETGAEAAPLPRNVPTVHGDRNRISNGQGNVSVVSIRSPGFSRGVQTVADANAATLISRNNAVCKRHRRCRIRQIAIIGWY